MIRSIRSRSPSLRTTRPAYPLLTSSRYGLAALAAEVCSDRSGHLDFGREAVRAQFRWLSSTNRVHGSAFVCSVVVYQRVK